MTLRFMFAAHGAAGISFLASLVSDYVVVNRSVRSRQLFQLFHVASMSAGLGANPMAPGACRAWDWPAANRPQRSIFGYFALRERFQSPKPDRLLGGVALGKAALALLGVVIVAPVAFAVMHYGSAPYLQELSGSPR